LKEFSVIYTNRAKNLMAASFSTAFKDITRELNGAYQAEQCVMIPGSGSYAMEAVAGQFARFPHEANYGPCMVVRNGFFSFRWSDIWSTVYPPECARSPELIVVKGQPVNDTGDGMPQFAPPPIEQLVGDIKKHKPAVVFAPHVETSAGIMHSHEYIRTVADAVHSVSPDSIFVLDSIAAGNVWTPMKELGIDVLITAPQKGWTSPCSVGIAMLGDRAVRVMNEQNKVAPRGHSYAVNLAKWSGVTDAYKKEGGFMYYTTLPTDSLMTFRDVILETKEFGYAQCEEKTFELGTQVRSLLNEFGFRSVAHDECAAPTVVVSYFRNSDDADMLARFKGQGIQIAGGVPLKIDEPWNGGAPTFRLGLFGLDKLKDVDGSVATLRAALEKIA